MRKIVLLLLLLFVGLAGFVSEQSSLFTVPRNWPKPAYDFSKNTLTKEKVALGRALFYEPMLSRDNTVSCTSCHSQFTSFAHVDHDLSHGIDNQIGTRNAPALMNMAWQKSFMWDGSINHLDMQPLGPISNPKEMDEKIEHVVQKLQAGKLYPKLFYEAFGDSIITGEHLLKAMSQFMLTIVSSESKYDSVMRKESVFTPQEQNGYALFKKNCSSCHTEPLFTNYQYENNGLAMDTTLKDIGRMAVSHSSADSLKFKVPTLRNVEFSYPYMHDGRFKKLSDVMNHYTKGIQHNSTLAPQLQHPISLSSNEKVDVIAFLLTLTDKKYLFNTQYSYPRQIFSPAPKD